MNKFVTVDLLSGRTVLRGKTNRPQRWQVEVEVVSGDGQAVDNYSFRLGQAVRLSDCLNELVDLVWSEIGEQVGNTVRSVTCHVGI